MVLTLGEMDENVHFSLSMKVANELIKENKDFDMLIVPNADHSGVLFYPCNSCRASIHAVVVLPGQ
jgi:dipeptidyl-peptidase 4